MTLLEQWEQRKRQIQQALAARRIDPDQAACTAR